MDKEREHILRVLKETDWVIAGPLWGYAAIGGSDGRPLCTKCGHWASSGPQNNSDAYIPSAHVDASRTRPAAARRTASPSLATKSDL